MTKENRPVFTHSQQYVREVFEEFLLNNGFVSYKGQSLAWYRVVNNEVIQTLYFHTRRTWVPVFLDVGYGNHPLYVSPIYPSGVYYRDVPINDEIFSIDSIEKVQPKVTNMSYSPEIRVTCPNDEYKGLDIIEGIVKDMDQLHSAQDVYIMHKARYAGRGYRAASTDFFDEVIYNNDIELYEPCLEMIDEKIQVRERYPNPPSKITNMLNQLRLQKKTMQTKDRDEILAVLADRQKKIVKALQRNVGIQVLLD